MVCVETKAVYKLKCKRWKRQYCRIGWAWDGKAEDKSFLILSSISVLGFLDMVISVVKRRVLRIYPV